MANFGNNEDRKSYEALSSKEKQLYNSIAQQHPNWNHNQIMTKLSIEIQTDKLVEEGNDSVDQLTIWELVLKQAKLFLERLGCIKRELINKFDIAITSVKNAIKAGLKEIGNLISKIFNI